MNIFGWLQRATYRHPMRSNAPFHYVPTPAYNDVASLQVAQHYDIAKPRQDYTGGGGLVRGQLFTTQHLVYGLKGVPSVGVGQEHGQLAIQRTTTYAGGPLHDSDAAEYDAIFGQHERTVKIIQ